MASKLSNANEELTTRTGDVIRQFPERSIDPGRSALETVQNMQGQSEVVDTPPPVDPNRPTFSADTITQITKHVAIELFKGRHADTVNRSAPDLNISLGVVADAGLDAHSCLALGAAYITMEDLHGRSDCQAELKRAPIITHPAASFSRSQATLEEYQIAPTNVRR